MKGESNNKKRRILRKHFVGIQMEELKEREEIEKGEDFEHGNIEEEVGDIKRIPHWSKQLTLRGLVASLAIGIIYSIIVMKLNLTTGLVPTLNVSAALFAFIFLRTWTKLLHKAGVLSTPFTRQENTVVQTCAVACYSIAVGGWREFSNLVVFVVLINMLFGH